MYFDAVERKPERKFKSQNPCLLAPLLVPTSQRPALTQKRTESPAPESQPQRAARAASKKLSRTSSIPTSFSWIRKFIIT